MFHRAMFVSSFICFMTSNKLPHSGTRHLLAAGFTQSKHDHSSFTKQYDSGILAILVYVDDILVVSDSLHDISNLKASLDFAFTTKDLGEICFFLGPEICSTKSGFHINQCKFALDILDEAGHIGAKPLSLPFPLNIHPDNTSGTLFSDPTLYRRTVGRLLYLASTMLDLSFYIQQLSQFVSHLRAAFHVLCYV